MNYLGIDHQWLLTTYNRETTRIFYVYLWENTTPPNEVVLPKKLSPHLIKPLDLTTKLQESCRTKEHVKWQWGYRQQNLLELWFGHQSVSFQAVSLLVSGIESIKHWTMTPCTSNRWYLNMFWDSTCWFRSCHHVFYHSDQRNEERQSLRVKLDYVMISPDHKPRF